MTLVDTSVWIDHLRKADSDLAKRLNEGRVVCHPFIIGEIALGNIARRPDVLELLQALPAVEVAAHETVLRFSKQHDLAATGLGWVDVHLLTAAGASGAELLTHDRRLRAQAVRLRVG